MAMTLLEARIPGAAGERRTASAGAAAGVLAGLVMAAAAMLHSLATGMGFWFPVKLISATFFGASALVGGFGTILTGLVTHLAVSAVFGVLFAALIRRRDADRTAVGTGLAFGLVVWLFMTFLVLPVANPILRERVALIPGWWLFEHLIFGAALGWTPRLRRRMTRVLPSRIARPVELPR